MAGNYGYSSTVYVFCVRTLNGPEAYAVAGSPGEAIDAYVANQNPAYLGLETAEISVRIVSPAMNLTTDSRAGASSGITATAQLWATCYAATAAVGASGTNSSTGSQLLMIRSS